MPPPRKVDLLPTELRDWLRKAISAAGFGSYERIADDLNFQLEEAGMELRIQKSAIHQFGVEHQQFVQLQEEASAWTKTWMTDAGLESEAETHKILFQMINALAFKIMKGMLEEGKDVDPKDLHFIGRMLKDVMSSAGIREKIVADAVERAREEERERVADEVEEKAAAAGLTAESAANLRREILGVG